MDNIIDTILFDESIKKIKFLTNNVVELTYKTGDVAYCMWDKGKDSFKYGGYTTHWKKKERNND